MSESELYNRIYDHYPHDVYWSNNIRNKYPYEKYSVVFFRLRNLKSNSSIIISFTPNYATI